MTTKFDLDTYIQKYKGYTVVQRLLFIAKKASGSSKNTNIDIALAQQACDKLVQVVKTSSGMNIEAYQEAIEIFTAASKKDTTTTNNDNNNDSTLSHLLTTDVDWMTKAQTRSDELKAQLEHDLEMFKQNLIKESVRMGHNDLASFHLQRGDPKSALQFHLKNRDYCTTRKHVLDMTLNIITVALYLGNHALVQSQAMKGQHIPSIQDDSIANVDRGKLDVALGLAHLSKKDYRQAAFSFLNVPNGLSDSFASILHVEDVAIYGTLCALATFDRSLIKTKLIDNENVRSMLELVPSMRELVNDFYSGKYGSSLSFLNSYRQHLSMDIYISRHVNAIIQKINEKAIMQYFSAFVSVKLPAMADALNTSVEKLEKDAAKLIEENKLNGRIDSHLKVLHAKSSNQRRQAFEDAIQSGEDFISEANSTMLRMNIAKFRFVHDDKNAKNNNYGGTRGGGGGRGGPRKKKATTTSMTTSGSENDSNNSGSSSSSNSNTAMVGRSTDEGSSFDSLLNNNTFDYLDDINAIVNVGRQADKKSSTK